MSTLPNSPSITTRSSVAVPVAPTSYPLSGGRTNATADPSVDDTPAQHTTLPIEASTDVDGPVMDTAGNGDTGMSRFPDDGNHLSTSDDAHSGRRAATTIAGEPGDTNVSPPRVQLTRNTTDCPGAAATPTENTAWDEFHSVRVRSNGLPNSFDVSPDAVNRSQ